MDANCPNPQQQSDPQHAKGGGIMNAVLKSVVNTVAYAIAINRAVWHLVMKDGTIAAMGREAIKDVRGTMHETWFGKNEHHGEAGAPLNPTQGEVAAERKGSVYGTERFATYRSPSQIIDEHRGSVHGQGGQVVQSPSQIIDNHRNGVHGQDRSNNGNILTQEDGKPGETQKPGQTQEKPGATQEKPEQTQEKPPVKEPEWGERRDGKEWKDTVPKPARADGQPWTQVYRNATKPNRTAMRTTIKTGKPRIARLPTSNVKDKNNRNTITAIACDRGLSLPHIEKMPEGTFFDRQRDSPRQPMLGAGPQPGIGHQFPLQPPFPLANPLKGFGRGFPVGHQNPVVVVMRRHWVGAAEDDASAENV